MNRFTTPLLLLGISLLSACYGTTNNSGLQGDLSMGMPSEQNQFDYPENGDPKLRLPVATGTAVQRDVWRLTAHWSSCSLDQPGCGAVSPPLAKLELVDCGCLDVGACECASAYADQGVTKRLTLQVTGRRDGKTVLRVRVKADGEPMEDTFPIAFQTAAP